MNNPRKFSRAKKIGLAGLGLALAVSTVGGVALAAGADDWYEGDNASVADHDNTGVALKLYNASGTEVTSGSTTAPIAAVATAAGTVRAGDTFASLFVHLPQSSTAPGAWPGVQVTGTEKFSGKPSVATTADGYTLADVAAILPNKETAASFAGVYELRLRTSSPSAGVSTEYAVAYVKISGSTWKVTDAPVFGQAGDTATSTKATWPKKIVYGKTAAVKVTVVAATGSTKPTGSVRVVSGTKTIGRATLAGGTATVTLAKKSLKPGKYTLVVRYDGATGAFTSSQSAAKTITVVKKK